LVRAVAANTKITNKKMFFIYDLLSIRLELKI